MTIPQPAPTPVMKKFLGPCAWLALGATLASVHAAPAPSKWERSIVTLEVTSKQYDYQQPWAKRQGNIQKNAVVVGARELLTTADGLADHTLIRAQAGGRGKWSNASLRWLDYHANLALLTSDDDALWKELRPAALASSPPLKGEVQILRWREKGFEHAQQWRQRHHHRSALKLMTVEKQQRGNRE